MEYFILFILLLSGVSIGPKGVDANISPPQPLAVCPRALDLVLLVDVSRSIISTNPENRALLIQFLVKVIDQFIIDTDMTHVSMVLFREDANIVFFLNQYFTSEDVKDGIKKGITYFAGQTDIATALEVTRIFVFSSFGGDRPDVPNVAILVTDGAPSINVDDTLTQAEKLKYESTLISIGVTDSDLTILQDLATPDCFLQASNFSYLHKTIDTLLPMVCSLGSASGQSPTAAPTTSTLGTTRNTRVSLTSTTSEATTATQLSTQPSSTESSTQTNASPSSTWSTIPTRITQITGQVTNSTTTVSTTTLTPSTATVSTTTLTPSTTSTNSPPKNITIAVINKLTTTNPLLQEPFCTEHTHKVNGVEGTIGGKCLEYFFWKDVMYKTCTHVDHKTYWCYINSRDWANCHLGPCIEPEPQQFCTEYTTNVMGKGEYGGPCVFPFMWKGVLYHSCTNMDYHSFWCYIDGHTIWAVCPSAPCRSPSNQPLCHDYTVNVNGIAGTVGGPCLSLFYWKDIPYFECTKVAYKTYWCFIDNKNWAECPETPCSTKAALTYSPREKRDLSGYNSFSRPNATYLNGILMAVAIHTWTFSFW